VILATDHVLLIERASGERPADAGALPDKSPSDAAESEVR